MNPLFTNFEEWKRKVASQIHAGDMEGLLTGLKRTGEQTGAAFRQLGQQLNTARRQKALQGTDLHQLFADVSRHAGPNASPIKGAILDAVLGQFGPAGDVINSVLRSQSGRTRADAERLTQQAIDLLAATNPGLLSPEGRARATPEQRGFVPAKPAVPPPPEWFERSRQRAGDDDFLSIDVAGAHIRARKDDPLFTGEMIDVESSNVHSIGYRINPDAPSQGALLVRFRQNGKSKRTAGGPGPLYEYAGVSPQTFNAFRRAASKGGFVWDELRVRGSRSLHQYDYKLVGISGGYVPRRATRIGSKEYYIGRNFNGSKSQLPSELVGSLPNHLVREHGRPNRAKPNRGTPNRGR